MPTPNTDIAEYSLDNFAGFFPPENIRRFGDAYICTNIKVFNLPPDGLPAMRLDALTIVFARHGSVRIQAADKSFTLRPGTVTMVPPHMPVRVPGQKGVRAELHALCLSRAFLTDVNLDMDALSAMPRTRNPEPLMAFSDSQMERILNFYRLLRDSAENPRTVFSLNIARSLCAGLFYQMMQFVMEEQAENARESNSKGALLVQRFVHLAHMHFREQRSVEFYADALCISSRHLTQTVSRILGRTPGTIISDMVIMEAKNLLRFSGKTIQQVAYALHFPSQSTFGKYFRHHTGLSPTAYQHT